MLSKKKSAVIHCDCADVQLKNASDCTDFSLILFLYYGEGEGGAYSWTTPTEHTTHIVFLPIYVLFRQSPLV